MPADLSDGLAASVKRLGGGAYSRRRIVSTVESIRLEEGASLEADSGDARREPQRLDHRR